MKYLSQITILLTLSFFLSLTTNAQQYYFKSYSIEQGLPQSTIFCALEDQRGEMWVGTEGSGICRFNGIDFQIIDQNSGLSGNIVRSIFEDSQGNIWIGTVNGLDKYDGNNIQSFSSTAINETTVLAINEDASGNIWVGTETKGLFKLSTKDSLNIENYTTSNGLVNMFIFDIDFDDHNRMWLSLIGGVNVVEYGDEDFNVTKLVEGVDIPSGFILCGDKDIDGNMWFGTLQQGVFKIEVDEDLDKILVEKPDYLNFLNDERIWDIHWTTDNDCFLATEDNGAIRFDHSKIIDQFNKDNGLNTNQIYRISESKKGGVWFSTLGNGILKFDNKLIVKYWEGNGINGTQVYDAVGNNEEEIFIGTDEGFSIYQFKDDIPVPVRSYNKQNGLLSNEITSISYSKDIIWLGSSVGLTKIEGGKASIPALNNMISSKNVNCLLYDTKENLWVGTDNGYSLYRNGDVYNVNEDDGIVNNEIQVMIEHSSGDIWLGTLGGLIRLRDSEYTDFIKEDGLSELSIYALAEDKNGDIWLGTQGGGLFLFEQEYDSIPIRHIAGNEILSSNIIHSLKFLSDSVLIASTENGFDQITLGEGNTIKQTVHYDVNDGYPGGKNNSLFIDKNSIAWFGNNEGLVRFNPEDQTNLFLQPETQIKTMKLFFEEQNWKKRGNTLSWFNLPENLILTHNENHITIGFSSIYYGNHMDLSYSYFLDGQSKNWSPFQSAREVVLPGLRPGKYNFQVKAKNKYDIVGPIANFSFVIKPPFWMRPWFIILAVIFLLFIVVTVIQLRTRKLQQEKIQLEKIVEERTREVVEQKDEIEKQHDIVVKQNIEIESSIHYAERIQKAVIPSNAILEKNFKDSFILFRPQHIVSGDFYWIGQKGDYIIFTAVDCTGHGVPGAFMSMLGISYLNQIIIEENTVMPNEILDKLRSHIINSFKQKGDEEADRKDGMDISLCTFNVKTKKLYYSGAYNPLYLIRTTESGPELIEYNADKMPVGLYARMDNFKLNEVDYKPNDAIYMFSDGFADQFGGERFKKFMRKHFKQMMLENQEKSFSDQRKVYDDMLCEWMAYKDIDGNANIQTDDILLIGVKL